MIPNTMTKYTNGKYSIPKSSDYQNSDFGRFLCNKYAVLNKKVHFLFKIYLHNSKKCSTFAANCRKERKRYARYYKIYGTL